MSCPITVAVLHEIRCDGVEPRRESLTGLELGAVLIDTHESFLRCIGSVFLVLQTTNEVMKQFLGVTPHEVMQRSVMAGREAGHVRPVAFVHRHVSFRQPFSVVVFVAHGFTLTEKLALPLPRGPS